MTKRQDRLYTARAHTITGGREGGTSRMDDGRLEVKLSVPGTPGTGTNPSDMRFASREKAILSQWEVGAGLVPGGGPMARLPRLIGRGRALEVLLGADDIPGGLAELYGYVNRALPDAELDSFEALAVRIASFDKRAIAETKRLVDIASLPPDAEIVPEWDAFVASLGRPASRAKLKALMKRGFHTAGDVENRLGYYVGQLGAAAIQNQ